MGNITILTVYIFMVLLAVLTGVASVSEYHDPHCIGDREVIVELFEWTWNDIVRECENFLGPKKFCGVQVSPPNEHVIMTSPPDTWSERYQPVSYKLESRSGTEEEFRRMVQRCRAVDVRIYVDAVFNNMAEIGRYGTGSAGSSYDSDFRQFGAVPYDTSDFNDASKCPSPDGFVNNMMDVNEIRNCSYEGLTDLDQSSDDVQNKVAAYLNHLIDLGVAGFRVDKAKFMWPEHIKAILHKVRDLPEGGRPFVIEHVTDYGNDVIATSEYTDLGYVTEFQYSRAIAEAMSQGLNQLQHIQHDFHGMTPSQDALIFVDNHETQREQNGSLPHLTFRQPKDFAMATAFTLAYNYGLVRLMSSYNFSNFDEGPPSYGNNTVKSVFSGASNACSNGWICEHRWPAIAEMVRFRNAVNSTDVNHWASGTDFLAFSRGDRGFFAMTSAATYTEDVKTGLPPGTYCELISECKSTITVDGNGKVHLEMNGDENSIVAVLTDFPVTSTIPASSATTLLFSSSETSLSSPLSGTVPTSSDSPSSATPSNTDNLLSTSLDVVPSELSNSSTVTDDYGSGSTTEAVSEISAPVGAEISDTTSFLTTGMSTITSLQGLSSTISSATDIPSSTLHRSTLVTADSLTAISNVASAVTENSDTTSDTTTPTADISTDILYVTSDVTEISNTASFETAPALGSSFSLSTVESAITTFESTTPQESVSKTTIALEATGSTTTVPDFTETMTDMPETTAPEPVSSIISESTEAEITSPTITITTSTAPNSTISAAPSAATSTSFSSVITFISSEVSLVVTTTETTTLEPTEPEITSPTTTESTYRRTIILLHWVTKPGEYVFFRGGIDENHRQGCGGDVSKDPCAIPIHDRDEGFTTHYDEYNAWRQGDNYLDWHGKEPGQGDFHGQQALGTPGIWTSNRPGDPGYNQFNVYGDHYWLLDVDMDCSRTAENGYFELKAFTNHWEPDIPTHACEGSGSNPGPPYTSVNHFARCGYINVFKDGGRCEIKPFEDVSNFQPIIG